MCVLDLNIAGLALRMETDRALEVQKAFEPFLRASGEPDLVARYREVEELPPIPETILHESECYRVHPDGKGGYVRSFFDPPRGPEPYALAEYDYQNGSIRMDYLSRGERCLSQMGNSFFHLGFESLLLYRRRFCLHGACVATDFGGIIFSGRSGIGKSTQAELWCSHRNARQINGDRPILEQTDIGWLAWGSPYAGSSRCHVNESCPVTAIVMLRQEKQCSLRRLNRAEAFRAVWSGLTVHSWDAAAVEKACDLAMALVEAVPVLELCCTPDEEAVRCLEQALRKECGL